MSCNHKNLTREPYMIPRSITFSLTHFNYLLLVHTDTNKKKTNMNSRIPIGDYSLLMDSIEGKLDSYVNRHSQNSSSNNTSADISILNNNTRIFSPTSRMPTTSKRRNVEYSSTDTPINYSSSIPIQDFNLSTGKKLRLAVESDELRIQNEQLIEKMERVESEHGRTKEKLERQLGFLDSENNELRAALNRSNDKYFEEKKNWQTKIRSLEADIASIKKQQSQELVSTKDQHRSTRVTPSSNDDKLLSQIQNLEIQLLQKSEEVKHLMKARAKSEEKVSKLQQDLIMARMNSAGDDAGFESVADEDDGDTLMRGQPNKSATIRIRELERKCNDLESSLRKKSQELEKYTSKYENQAILTDENLNLKNKLQLAQGRINELQSIEGKFLSLNHEKEHWSAIIKEVIPSSHTLLGSEHDGIVGSGNGDIGPTGVLRMLAATQKKCATVCQNEGKLETQVRELKRSLSTMQSQMKSLEDSKAKLTEQYESATKSSARLQQEVKSYENEVNSLRDLMRTYDTEFSIGRRAEAASTSSVVAEKEKVIASLRSELDLSRESCASLRVTINKTEQYVNDLQAQVSRLEEESKSIKNSARSTVDLDYDPKVTKVSILLLLLKLMRLHTYHINSLFLAGFTLDAKPIGHIHKRVRRSSIKCPRHVSNRHHGHRSGWYRHIQATSTPERSI